MKIYSAQPINEFLENVRAQACASKAPPSLIDKIDELLERPDLDDEIEKAGEEFEAMRDSRDDLAGELRDLLHALDNAPDGIMEDAAVRAAVHSAANGLKRSGNKPA